MNLSMVQTHANRVPTSTNLLNNDGTRAARHVSNDARLVLNARPDPGPAPPTLPAYRPTSTWRTGHDHGIAITDLMLMVLLLFLKVLGWKNVLSILCVGSTVERRSINNWDTIAW